MWTLETTPRTRTPRLVWVLGWAHGREQEVDIGCPSIAGKKHNKGKPKAR